MIKHKVTIGLLLLLTAVVATISVTTTLAATSATQTIAYYDANKGGTPDTQDMEYATFGFPSSQAVQFFDSGSTVLDTTAVMNDYAGYGITPTLAPDLDSTAGFTLTFTVQIEAETHDSGNDRGGLEVILLDNNAKGINLSFWEDTIFAHEGGTTNLFEYAEDVSFDTTTGLITYQLAILGDSYTLTAPGLTPLTGDLRDYSAFNPPIPGAPDPYEQPNFVFLGDPTTSASARIRLSYVALTVPADAPMYELFLPFVTK